MKRENSSFYELLFEEARQQLEMANNAGSDNAAPTYVASAFHRLAEAWLQHTTPNNLSDFDIHAIAQTAEEYFKKRNPFLGQVSMEMLMAHLLAVCLGSAFNEEGRKIVLPAWNYHNEPQPDEDELDEYGSGYDPLALHKFAQRVITKGVLRVRGDEQEIFRAILEFNEARFPEVSTREAFIDSLSDQPAEIRDAKIAEFDRALCMQSEQTHEIIAQLLRQSRERMVREYSQAVFHAFMELGDHGIRCGIIATLFAASHYSNVFHAAAVGAPDRTIDKVRPTLTDLKKTVAEFFADWLTQPLATKPHEGREQEYKLSGMDEQFQTLYPKVGKAKKCYTRNKDEDNWRGLVERAVPEMPADLIERLGANTKARQNQPRSIALEWAARLAGAGENYPNNHYDTAYLSNRLSKLKKATLSSGN